MSVFDSLALWWQSRKTKRKMERVFSRGADPFKYSTSAYELKRLAAMERALGEGPLGRVLEIGCAEGHFTERLAKRAVSLEAVDISDTAIARAKARAPKAAYHAGDIRTWEPSERFDLVVVGDILYYLDKPGVRAEFEKTFERIASWAPTLMLAHAFATPDEETHRRGFTSRFEALGFKKTAETVVSPDDPANPVRCLVVTLSR